MGAPTTIDPVQLMISLQKLTLGYRTLKAEILRKNNNKKQKRGIHRKRNRVAPSYCSQSVCILHIVILLNMRNSACSLVQTISVFTSTLLCVFCLHIYYK